MGLKDSRVVRVALAVNDGYSQDRGGYLSAAIAYYAFLSLFPLLLLGLSIVGFVLAGNAALREDIIAELSGSVPGLLELFGGDLDKLVAGRSAAGIIGLATLLWTGTGVAGAGRNAISRIFRTGPPPGGIRDKAWLVGVTAGLGLLGLVATAAATVAAGLGAEGALGVVLLVGGSLVAFALDAGLFLVAYRILTPGAGWRQVRPGALFAAIGWMVLKIAGTWYATYTAERATSVYGTFATTVGVLVVLYLAARVFVYGAELNAVLIREEGGGPVTDQPDGSQALNPRDASTMKLVGQVAGDVGTLVKKEVELARQEIMEGISARVKAIAALAVVATLGLFVLGFLGAAAAAALDLVMATWAALLIVAGAFVLLAAIAAAFGIRRLKSPPLSPEKAKQTIKEDMEWAKAQLRR